MFKNNQKSAKCFQKFNTKRIISLLVSCENFKYLVSSKILTNFLIMQRYKNFTISYVIFFKLSG